MEATQWLTVEEAADIAKVHEQTIRRWLRAGTLKGHLISRRAGYRIQSDDLSAFMSGVPKDVGREETANDPALPGR